LFLKGDLGAAEAELQEAVDLHRDIGSAAGEAHSLQRLAEVKLAVGNRTEANRLLYRALPLAHLSSVAMHIIQRVYGTMITAATTPDAARAMVDRAEASIGFADQCVFCSIMLAVPAATACADVGDIEEAKRHLSIAQKSAVFWQGTAWEAAILESQAHLSRAEGNPAAASAQLHEAAALFDTAGQPLDAERCRAEAFGGLVHVD
jgi:tetratricopeptide (TPR) repeat protein